MAAGACASSCEVLDSWWGGMGVCSSCFFAAVRFFADEGMAVTNKGSMIIDCGWRWIKVRCRLESGW